MKFITKLRNRLKKITSVLLIVEPDSDDERLVILRHLNKTAAADSKKAHELFNNSKQEPDSGKIQVENLKNLLDVLSPMAPVK